MCLRLHKCSLDLWVQQRREYRVWQKNKKAKKKQSKQKKQTRKPKPRKKQEKNCGKCRFCFFVCCVLVFFLFFLFLLVILPVDLFFWWLCFCFCFCFCFFAKIHFLCSTRGHNTRFFLIQSDKFGTCPIMIEYHQSLCDESVFNPAKWLWLQGTPKTKWFIIIFCTLSFWINLRQSEGISMPESLRSSCSCCSASLGPAWEMCFLWSFLLRLGVRGHVSSCFQFIIVIAIVGIVVQVSVSTIINYKSCHIIYTHNINIYIYLFI